MKLLNHFTHHGRVVCHRLRHASRLARARPGDGQRAKRPTGALEPRRPGIGPSNRAWKRFCVARSMPTARCRWRC